MANGSHTSASPRRERPYDRDVTAPPAPEQWPGPKLRAGLALGAVILIVLVGVFFANHRSPRSQSHSDHNVINMTGYGDIHFGQPSTDLTVRHGLHDSQVGCRPRFVDLAHLRPVFVDGKLAMLWADPPVHTPEGVSVGTDIAEVRQAYPDAVALPAPGPYQYSGLLVTRNGMGYLFLFEGSQVKKMIVGYETYLRQIFATASDAC